MSLILAVSAYLTRLELELIEAAAGCAVGLRYMTAQIALGDLVEVDLTSYAQLASTLLRITARLGLQRRTKDATPSITELRKRYGDDQQGEDVTRVSFWLCAPCTSPPSEHTDNTWSRASGARS